MNTITQCYKILLLAITLFIFSQKGISQTCYMQAIDHIGVKSYIHDLQEIAACKLKDSINIPILEIQSDTVDFKVLGYNLYPVLGAVDEKFGMDAAFEMVEADLLGKSDYLAIVKYLSLKDKDSYNLVEEKVMKYKVYIDLPDVGGYDTLSNLELDALTSHLNSFLVEKLNASNSPVAAEVNTMREMWNYLKKPKSLDELLLNLKFIRFEVPDESEFMITRTTDELDYTPIDAYDNVYNYGGYVLNDETIEESLLNDDPGDFSTLTSSYFLAGKEVSNTVGEFEDFYAQFSNDPSKVKLFIYFDFETEVINTIAKGKTSDSRGGEQRYGYYKMDENLSKAESEEILDNYYESIHEENTKIESNAELIETVGSCVPSWKFGRKCLYNHVNNPANDFGLTGDYISMQAATIAGFVDGFLGTIQFLVQATTFVRDNLFEVVGEGVKFILLQPNSKLLLVIGGAISSIFENEENNAWETLKEVGSYLITMDPILIGISGLYSLGKMAIDFIKTEITSKFGGSAYEFIAYQIGVVAFDAVLTGVTGGAYLGAKVIARGSQVALKVGKTLKSSKNSLASLFNRLSSQGKNTAGRKGKVAYCSIGSEGCFVRDTPVLMASGGNQYSLRNTGKALAVAAAMPIVAVPIQEVQLLDYAVAHETVNSVYGLTAMAEYDDIYLGLMDKDPYTSDQQRERDEYELDDENWNEVVFEEVDGSSGAKLALHNDWINEKGYRIDAVVEMNLPEQGISGPFRITSVKHIIPQKKPVDEDESDDYDYKPITGLFIHAASEVWKIKFDNGEELGVTHNHPIYSTTIGDWQFAGTLKVGEEVLTKNGGAKVLSKTLAKTQDVYNLEVKNYHNFLVNDSGIVVHNSALCSYLKSLYSKYSQWHKAEPDWGLNDNFINQVMVDMLNDPTSIKGVTTTTYNGKTYLIEGHHRLRAAKRLKTEQGIDFELQHYDINPDKINTVTPHNNIEEFIQNTFLPDE